MGPFGQTKTEVHYEQHHHVARHWSDCVLCLRRHLGAQPLVGRSPRLLGVKEAKPESWRGVSDIPRQLFTDQSVWRDGDWNGFVRIALAGRLDFARGPLRQIRKYAIIQAFPKRQRSLLVG